MPGSSCNSYFDKFLTLASHAFQQFFVAPGSRRFAVYLLSQLSLSLASTLCWSLFYHALAPKLETLQCSTAYLVVVLSYCSLIRVCLVYSRSCLVLVRQLLVEVDAFVSGPGGNSDVHDGHGGDDALALGHSHPRSQSTTASTPPPSGADELPARITQTVESIPGPKDRHAEERAGSGKRRRVTGGSSGSGADAIGGSSSGRDSTDSSSSGGDGRKCGDVGVGGGGNGGGVVGDGDGDGDGSCGGDGACGGVHVLTYEGTITGLGSQVGGHERRRPRTIFPRFEGGACLHACGT